MTKRECPYCDHPNLASAKFCSACGAAMHLAPCPHCGAVNDISAVACYRCHGELTPPEANEADPSLVAAQTAEEPFPDQTNTVAEPASGRPSLLVIGIILIAFAAASYYAFRQRSTIDARGKAAPQQSEKPPTALTRPALPAAAIVEPAPQSALPPAAATPGAPETPPAPRSIPVNAKSQAPARRDPVAAVEQPPTIQTVPAVTPVTPATSPTICTEAVAALGLCKSDSKPAEIK